MNELEAKEKEYIQYIEEHIANVKLAYEKYGYQLCVLLNVSPLKLSQNVSKHDQSKYSDEEFNAYRNWFYPCQNEEKNKELFDKAWEHHYTNNPHHPQYWKTDMEPIAIAEMLLDWEAMSMKFGGNTYEYYLKERDKKGFTEKDKEILDRVALLIFYNK